jgi:hypothetical protein
LLVQLMTGGVVSTTVTTCVHVALFWQQSRAFQRKVTICAQGFALFVWAPTRLTLTAEPQQASNAVGAVGDQVELHCTVKLLPQVMTGGVLSTTATVWLHVIELLQQSVACQVRVMICGHNEPAFVIVLTMVTVRFVPQQLSSAVGGSKVQVVPHTTVLLLAQVSTGGWVSISRIV